MQNKTRAQSGLEYLVTYGWAIFIVLIVTGVLWYMRVFDGINFNSSVIREGGFSSFTPIDHYVNTTGAVILFSNSVTRRVTINTVTVGKDDEFADTNCNNGLPMDVSANERFLIVCSALPQGALAAIGEAYDLTVSISFTDSISTNDHTDLGFVKGKVA